MPASMVPAETNTRGICSINEQTIRTLSCNFMSTKEQKILYTFDFHKNPNNQIGRLFELRGFTRSTDQAQCWAVLWLF